MKIKKLPAAVKALKDFPATGIFNSHCQEDCGELPGTAWQESAASDCKEAEGDGG